MPLRKFPPLFSDDGGPCYPERFEINDNSGIKPPLSVLDPESLYLSSGNNGCEENRRLRHPEAQRIFQTHIQEKSRNPCAVKKTNYSGQLPLMFIYLILLY